MKALVTGATTPIARGVIDALLRDPEVDLVVASATAPDPRIPRAAVFEPADLHHTRDVHDLVWLAAAQHHIDTVIHLGGPCDPRAHAPGKDAVAARQLVLRCAEHPTIRRFVYRSFSDVYAVAPATSGLLDEDAGLDFDLAAPAWRRARVAADAAVTDHLGGRLEIAVLRLAEVFAADTASQLWDYLTSRLCLRPLGFDPMINLLSVEDAVAAILLAARSHEVGAFNIPGADTLPLSSAIAEAGRAQLPLPGPLLGPVSALQRCASPTAFRHDGDLRRFRFEALLDGTRARHRLGYAPHHPVRWPRAWWRVLIERLAAAS